MNLLADLSPVGLATLAVLGLCSILMVAVAIERLYYLGRNHVAADWLHSNVAWFLKSGQRDDALQFVQSLGGLLPRVYEVGLLRYHLDQDSAETAMSNSIALQRLNMERFLPVLGTIAVIAPFIGLFGTVVGIMHTFEAVAQTGQAGVAVVAAGVSEALVATAAGLFVAIGSVVFFNYFKSRINSAVATMAASATKLSEMMELARTGTAFPEDLLAVRREE